MGASALPYRVNLDVSSLLDAVRDLVGEDLPRYSDSLMAAFDEVDPVFTRTGYCDFFWHCASSVPGWLPHTILANAEAESMGSGRLLKLWQRVDYNDVAEREIMIHGIDESRHSRVFIGLVERAFPTLVAPEYLDELRRTLPDIRGRAHVKEGKRIEEDVLIDALVQMNIAEIRTRIHLELFAPLIYGLSPVEDRPAVFRILRALGRDEVRHIGYTARLMEQWNRAGAGDLLRDLYEKRLRDFNAMTIAETEGARRAFGRGEVPDLLDV